MIRILFKLLAASIVLQAQTVEFNRDIQPILSDRCYTCHGPDAANRKTPLRWDTEAGVKQGSSQLLERVSTDDKARRMPPVYSGAPKLSAQEIDLIRRWVEQGAEWQGHWSLKAPRRVELPKPSGANWGHNGIDQFVLQRLEQKGLKPSPEAAMHTLIRRVTLDLTGLPPTPGEVEAFVKDTTPNAYEKVVDRLLASPRYGERMAIRWLDAARYADTNGYQTDAERYMWRWRDWVIDAFNSNMPFDRFTVEQLAGDLLPNPTQDQLVATGFNRNHRGNGEGGIIPEEYAVEYVVDRVETTSTVWLGLTVGCARCHDHKYDPIKQKEFYQFFGYFNNIPERGKYFKYGNTPPVIPAPTPEQRGKLEALRSKLRVAEGKFETLKEEVKRGEQEWEKGLGTSEPLQWARERDLVKKFAFGRGGAAGSFDGKRSVDGGDIGKFGFYDRFTLAAWIHPTAQDGAIVTRADDELEAEGYGLYLKDGKLQVNMVTRWLDDCARVETEDRVQLNRWSHVLATYDGTREASGISVFIDGRPVKLKILVDELNQGFASKKPLRVGFGGGYHFQGLLDEVRVYSVALDAREAAMLAESASLGEIARIPAEQRSAAQKDKLRRAYLHEYATEPVREAWKQVLAAQREHDQFRDSLPTVMVMQENPKPAETRFLVRGAYDRPGDVVQRGLPALLPPMPPGAPNNRLGLARWLVDPSHPLTARVTVNRFWQMYFGTGIVRTVEDFGSQGELPSHPALLDWLAAEFVRTGWDVKALQKTIVMSATYWQSSRVSEKLAAADPDNRLLARGPRFRLPPEMLRDQALAVSGLMVGKLGGPSVKPYQPAGLWKELSGGADYQRDKGEGLYRRSMYTFWKRAVPPPGMMTFDSAGREACVVRQGRTNTPLQALTLMNDVTYVEASRKMAERMMREGGNSADDRIGYGFLLATARRPGAGEMEVLLASLRSYRDKFQTDPGAAEKLLSEGDSPRDAGLDARELAAYTGVASLIMNLDETVTKE
ncbi:MAG: DUF1553 domain-containing protein [Acidobacteriia bacterium]|nr:DUF1553 domain-containing protein [Terriglobia bacterium]